MRPDEEPREAAEFYMTAGGVLHRNYCGQLQRASYPKPWPVEWERPDWARPARCCLAGEWPTPMEPTAR